MPLDSPVVEHLCGVLELGLDDKRCQGNEVYAIEFFADIQQRYRKGTSRERVDEGIGRYLISCDEWIIDNSDCLGWFQRCYYDFKGDGEYLLTFGYNVHAPTCYNGSYEDCLVPDDSEGQVWGYR